MSDQVPLSVLKDFTFLKEVNDEILANVHAILPFEYGCFVITNTDMVAAVGDNTDGELGVGHTQRCVGLEEIIELRHRGTIDIVHNDGCSAARTRDGEVWIWGRSYFHDRRNDRGQVESLNPRRIILAGIFSVKLGRHGLALSCDGFVHGWGNNYFGQLGMGASMRHQRTPVFMPGPDNEKVVQIACGRFHSWMVTASRRAFGFGLNDDYQLGLGTAVNQCKPAELSIANETIKSVSCSGDFSLLLTCSGSVYMCMGGHRTSPWPVRLALPVDGGAITSILTTSYLDHYHAVPHEWVVMQSNFFFLDQSGRLLLSGDLSNGSASELPSRFTFHIFDAILRSTHKQISPTLLYVANDCPQYQQHYQAPVMHNVNLLESAFLG